MSLATAFGKLAVLAVAAYLWVFYLRLGWFLPLVWVVGCYVSVYVTARERSRMGSRVFGIVGVLLLYNVVQVGVFAAATSRDEQIVAMRWTIEESGSGPEVALQFQAHPGHYVGFYSADLAESLAAREGGEVEAVFVVSSALGCMRGYSVERVGTLTEWNTSAPGYAKATTDDPGPWLDPFWCP